jgi:ABC-2 type transport system permease protein
MKTTAKYRMSFWTGLSVSMEYRFDFFMNILSTIFPIIIQVFLWSAIYGRSNENSMYGYSFAQMLIYTCMAGVVSKFVATQVEEKVNEDIHTGGLNKFLVMPVSYILFRLIYAIGEKVFSMAVILGLANIVLLFFHFGGIYAINPIQIAGFIPALILGMILNFLLFILISLSAFWLTEVGSFFHAIGVIIMVISGGVFPVEIFGSGFVQIIQYLPFLYTTGFPIRVITGSASGEQIIIGMCVQVGWSLLLWIAVGMVWNRGINRYSSVGG